MSFKGDTSLYQDKAAYPSLPGPALRIDMTSAFAIAPARLTSGES